jgi:hypothetical protein
MHMHIYIIITPNMAASSATPEPALNTLPSPVDVAVAADPVPEALDPVALALDPPPPDPPGLVAVAAASLDANVLLAVYSAGGKLVLAGPLTLATNM